MKEEESAARFYSAAALLPPRLTAPLKRTPRPAAAAAREIRLRAGQPLSLDTSDGPLFLDASGSQWETHIPPGALRLGKADLFESFRALCGYSVHTHQHEVLQGYLSLPGGHRAGVCGTMAGEGGLRDISSINLRVARQIPGAARELCRELFGEGLCGVLLAGAPASGKTTLLRDIARTASSGELGGFYKVSLIDERGELAALCQGVAQNDVGPCTDILSGYRKSAAIEIAVRTLSPQLIVCDEIGRADELEAVRSGLFSAVRFVATVHCSSREDLLRRPQARGLLETGAFERVVLLRGADRPGEVQDIISASRL